MSDMRQTIQLYRLMGVQEEKDGRQDEILLSLVLLPEGHRKKDYHTREKEKLRMQVAQGSGLGKDQKRQG